MNLDWKLQTGKYIENKPLKDFLRMQSRETDLYDSATDVGLLDFNKGIAIVGF